MPTSHPSHVENWLSHIHALSEEIGPRGSTTDGERRGHEYCSGILGRLGLSPQTETYAGARSIFLPHLLGSIAFLVAFILYPLAGRASAGAGVRITGLCRSGLDDARGHHRPFPAGRELVALAERLSQEHPEWGAYPTYMRGGNTEMADALRQHIPAITLAGNDRQHNLPNWHQVGDTFDKISPDVAGRTYDFAWTFIRALDEQEIFF